MSTDMYKNAVQNRWIDQKREPESARNKNGSPDPVASESWSERREKWLDENMSKRASRRVTPRNDCHKKAAAGPAKLTHTVMLRSILLARKPQNEVAAERLPEHYAVLSQRCFVPDRPGMLGKSPTHLYKQVNVCPACYNMYVALDTERSAAQNNDHKESALDDIITSPWTTNWTCPPGRLETARQRPSSLKNSPQRPVTARPQRARPASRQSLARSTRPSENRGASTSRTPRPPPSRFLSSASSAQMRARPPQPKKVTTSQMPQARSPQAVEISLVRSNSFKDTARQVPHMIKHKLVIPCREAKPPAV